MKKFKVFSSLREENTSLLLFWGCQDKEPDILRKTKYYAAEGFQRHRSRACPVGTDGEAEYGESQGAPARLCEF
ncbi:MAG: hypothetical protein IJ381_02210, partial [Clostridia bacterium]|nr:hypothetical protein [Clostridia bacterium]